VESHILPPQPRRREDDRFDELICDAARIRGHDGRDRVVGRLALAGCDRG
jgi:hypothetical protein